jgi:hypothetical protein
MGHGAWVTGQANHYIETWGMNQRQKNGCEDIVSFLLTHDP